MENEIVKQAFDYGVVPVTEREELKQIADEIRFFGKKRVEITFKIGEGLARARDIFRHDKSGGFQEWLKTEFNESSSRAYQYINFYEELGCSTFHLGRLWMQTRN
jgi:hypothetical protein